ncbi:hypothetical protein V6N13_042786 [Hibiscus sabdariffa]
MLGQQDGDTLLREYDEPSKVGCDCLGDDTSSMVLPSNSGVARKSLLMEMLEKSEEISGCMLEDFKKDGLSLDLQRILANDCHNNWLELPQQRRLHPTMREGDENEVIKWLGVDITYPFNIFMPSRIVRRWRVFMDYKGTRKKYTSMVVQKGATLSKLTQLFMGNIVTRWRLLCFHFNKARVWKAPSLMRFDEELSQTGANENKRDEVAVTVYEELLPHVILNLLAFLDVLLPTSKNVTTSPEATQQNNQAGPQDVDPLNTVPAMEEQEHESQS